ncbi:hypothetical protein [Pseudoxanthomonas sp. PXM02]|uniref:hypothetical protein n=1 Tax=Pseudoxanthomonas sp. PXM02 TaxID=2769294 RepID=UPI00177ECB7E|nr:hypothetical protein [Pseudoxanthomonas sp. PXM02]MBD9480776.1 hypothetical protein [Pseudoxanthomonas sp. PXM02]
MSQVPHEIQSAIFGKAEEDHPGDFCAQKHMIELECAAYLEVQILQSSPYEESDMHAILVAACSDWPGNYQMQLRACQHQLEHRDLLARYQDDRLPHAVVDTIKAKAARDWPRNLMFRYLSLNRQCEAWLAIEELRASA